MFFGADGPRVARSSQPWADMSNPFGVLRCSFVWRFDLLQEIQGSGKRVGCFSGQGGFAFWGDALTEGLNSSFQDSV
jgi:hypothetical protein